MEGESLSLALVLIQTPFAPAYSFFFSVGRFELLVLFPNSNREISPGEESSSKSNTLTRVGMFAVWSFVVINECKMRVKWFVVCVAYCIDYWWYWWIFKSHQTYQLEYYRLQAGPPPFSRIFKFFRARLLLEIEQNPSNLPIKPVDPKFPGTGFGAKI